MKLAFQENKNGNGKLTGKFEDIVSQWGRRRHCGHNVSTHRTLATPAELTADNLKFACAELGIPDDKHTLRRAARGFDLYYSGKVEHVTAEDCLSPFNDHTFLVESQYNRQSYQVTLHYGATKTYGYCTCQDWMNYSGDMDVPNVDFWCKHMISSALWLHNNGNGNGTKVVNACGTEYAKDIQDKLNGTIQAGLSPQMTTSNCQPKNDNGNGADKAPSQPQLEIRNPFQEAELKDITQIEGLLIEDGRLNIEDWKDKNNNHSSINNLQLKGELAWTLRNGETVISYKGIMTLAEKHGISFSVSHHEDTNTVIAYARRNENRSERISGKPVRVSGSVLTASELAKRNAARQLIPFAEIKVLELKAKLEADFSWQKAKAKCVELVGTDANVAIIIHELVQSGKLRQDNPSHYNRIEWLMIHNACKDDDNNDGVSDTPSSDDPKSLSRWSYNSPAFIEKCREAINKVRAAKTVEANEMPLENNNGIKRKIQMDSKLKTWLVEADGTKKAISCREICEKFDGSIVTRLRGGIDSGADISTVELED